jgi:cell division protein FtsQ
MKRAKPILLWLIGLCLWVALLSHGQREKNLILGEKYHIEFIDRPLNSFIGKEELAKEVEILRISSKTSGLEEINIQLLEESLDNHPSIEKAEVYSNLNGTLHIEVWQHQPLARLLNAKRSDYLIRDGALMPLSNQFSEKVPLVTGPLAFSQKETVAAFWLKLAEKKELKNVFSGLHCQADSNWILYPVKGNYTVELGKAINIGKKLDNLKNFFKYSGQMEEIQKLESINLEFNNQVICRKK